MSERQGTEVIRFDRDNRRLMGTLNIYAIKNKTNVPHILMLEIGLSMDDVEDIYNHQEISEEKRQFIDEWIEMQRLFHNDVLSDHKDELAARRLGKAAATVDARTQPPAYNYPVDIFGSLGNFFDVEVPEYNP